jgi:hypothetical protein
LYIAAKPQAEAYPQLRRYMYYMWLLSFGAASRAAYLVPHLMFSGLPGNGNAGATGFSHRSTAPPSRCTSSTPSLT